MEKHEEKKERLKAMKEFTGDSNLELIDIDDSFGFKCQQCGKCCMNRTDIVLNPFDIYNGAKYLGITPQEFFEKYCFSDLGATSKIPMILLRTSENGFCPLLKLDVKDGGKFKCMIHAAKPGACSNHPIGVVYSHNNDSGESNLEFIKVSQCPNSVSDEQQIVREWVKPYLDHAEEITVAHKIQHLATEYFDTRNFWLFLRMLYDASKSSKLFKDSNDDNIIQIAMTQYALRSIDVGYLKYDINQPFIEQAENNIKVLEEFYTNTKNLFKNLADKFEEKMGKTVDEAIKEFYQKGGTTDDGNN